MPTRTAVKKTIQHTNETAVIDPKVTLSVLEAVQRGDFSARLPTTWSGPAARVASAFNDIIEANERLEREVRRLSRQVGKEGLVKRASARHAGGAWATTIEAVNDLAEDLARPNAEIARVISAVAKGDLSQTMPLEIDGRPLQGQFLTTAKTVNTMVGQLNAFAGEVTRVAREVGTEGKLGGQAQVRGVGGVWKDLTDNVNLMAGNLTSQVRNIAEVTTAVQQGDLSKKITVDVQGEILELKNTINTMVDQLNAFAGEVTRVAREVGTEGKLGGQADVKGVGGTWKDLTDNVNLMAGNLTSQVRNIAQVTTGIANGDLSKKITVDVQGEILELKQTVNTMVDQLNAFANEVTRVAREVGTEGKLGGQADVKGVAGVWKDLTENVNFMAGNLTSQVRNIAEVTTAVQQGDLSKKITVDVRGEILELKNTINTMVDQLNAFAGEVTRVAREVGTEGKLGGQAEVKGVGGVWKDLTDNVNFMAGNLTSQVRNIAEVTTAVQQGDLSKKITVDVQGEILELKQTINTMVDQLNAFASEVTRVAREVGTEGKLGGQADVKGVGGIWKDLTDNVNLMAGNLTSQVRNIAEVTAAVQQGNLSKKITVDVRGEILELKDTINTMVDQLNAFAKEVTRVAREVGTDGKLGGQAQVEGVAGTWKDLTDNVNTMASNLTDQVRGIARVVTAVANGDLRGKLTLEAKGEIAELADTINSMTQTLAVFAQQVTTVAREGADGRLGGQANVPGAAGTWRDLTDNVNQLSATLTTQVRAIAEVATAVTKGDLTRTIRVDASGEVANLKDNINEMIGNLRATTEKNREQDWLKTNLTRFTRMLQGQRDPMTVSKMILSELAPLVHAKHAVFYGVVPANGKPAYLSLQAGYAYKPRKNVPMEFTLGEGLVGQCALEKKRIVVTNVPREYIRINSALGEAAPANIVVLPVLFEGDVRAVVELASFEPFSATHLDFLDQLAESIGIVLNTIEANSRTEDLLKQSQSLATELQSQQEQLQHTNEELAKKASQLAEQNAEIEQRRLEVESAKVLVEENVEQLALTSRYKSEFLANMSHELRTPLNSLLILAQELAANPDGNLLPKQIEYATIIRSSGTDLLKLINDILDLSKIESGTVALDISNWPLGELRPMLERTFRHVAEATKLAFLIELRPGLPDTMATDPQRLQQILNNLLSNAFKFTEKGKVEFIAEMATSGWSPSNETLNRVSQVIAFRVLDTGIGIPLDKQQSIFEAFAQADGSTSRKFGGTGLGLSICRDLTRLLGGEIRVQSEPGVGSIFTVYLPLIAPSQHRRGDVVDTTPIDMEAEEPREAVLVGGGGGQWQTEPVHSNGSGGGRKTTRSLLVVEDDPIQRQYITDLMAPTNTQTTAVSSGDEALELLHREKFDCVVLDLGLPGLSSWKVIEELQSTQTLGSTPLLVYTAKDLTRREEIKLGRAARSIVIKDARSPERLKQEIVAILRDKAPAGELEDELGSNGVAGPHPSLAGKKVLVVDDDIRNIFALTALLERQEMDVTSVDSGQEALEMLRHKSDIDVALIDVMMPEMDGYVTMTEMRKLDAFGDRPIIALTAKAMKGDREKCIEAGASDYIAKPVNNTQLLSMLESWLGR
jgi:HAMP domain-containing protein/signal transduction histidine kinase/CheY-like chemotaxis protein